MIHGAIFFVNILLFLLARPILNLIEPTEKNSSKIKIFRALNVMVLILHLVDLILLGANSNYQHYFIRLGYSLMTLYAAMFIYSLTCALSKRRFGKEKALDNQTLYLETYSSRLVEMVWLVIIVITAIYILIKIWQLEDMFTGIYGILAAFLAFTSGIWAPDIISGLIILNTEILEDGDVVIIEGHTNEYVISRVTLIYVVLYDIRNNHRTLMRNSLFTGSRIDNISRVASTNGNRHSITYKIGYPAFTGFKNERKEQLDDFKKSVSDMFETAYARCVENESIKVNPNQPFEWAMTNAGDYALEYTLWVYLARIPNSKVTSTLRRHLMGTMYKVNEAVFDASIEEGIDLSTPDVAQITLSAPAAAPALPALPPKEAKKESKKA